MTKKEFAAYQRAKFLRKQNQDIDAQPKIRGPYRSKLTDDERYKKLLDKWRKASEKKYARYRNDPIYRQKTLERKRASARKRRERERLRYRKRAESPEFRAIAAARKRAWVAKNRERQNATHRKYYEANREKYLADEIARRDRRDPARRIRRATAKFRNGELEHSEFVEVVSGALTQVDEIVRKQIGLRKKRRGHNKNTDAPNRHVSEMCERDHSNSSD